MEESVSIVEWFTRIRWLRKWKVSTVMERQISRWTIFLEIYKSRILWKLKEEKSVKTLSYQFSIVSLGSREVGEHHGTYGGYFGHEMVGMVSSFLERVNGRMNIHFRMKYTHPVDEKVKNFDLRVKGKSPGEHSSGMYSRRIS